MPSQSKTKNWDWQVRYTVILMCCAATFICYIDRVNISVAIIPMAEQYNWDLQTQGTVLSSFYVGYLLMQVVGGFLADRFGGKIVLGMGVLLWSFFTIVTPWAALSGMLGLIVARVCMGLGEAVTFPSVYSLISRWFPSNETAKAVALNASGIPVGTVFALLLTPIIVEQLGWEWAFYLFGLLGVVWYVAWALTITTNPEDHPKISTKELLCIRSNAPAKGKIHTPPIGAFLRNKAVWAIIVAHFCTNWTSYVFLSWLPKYVNDGLGVPFAAIGLIAMLPHLTSFICLNIAGSIADRLVQRGYATTFVRKLMQTIGFGGLATCLLLITTVETIWSAIGLLCLGNVFGAAGIGGHSVNHMDIGPKYSGTLMGITNTFATLPGIIAVYLTGYILQTTGSWDLVFIMTAGVTLFGMVFYLTFASGEKQFD